MAKSKKRTGKNKKKSAEKEKKTDGLRNRLIAIVERVCSDDYQKGEKEMDESYEAVQECRQMLTVYTQPLANTVMAYDMIKHLLEKVVIDSDKARLIRRMGKGQNAETNRQILAELLTRGVREFEVYVEGIRKQEFNLLADLLEKRHFSAMVNLLEPVAKKLGHHWKRIALELGTAGLVPQIENRYAKVREQAFYSLILWEETSGVAATENRLIFALKTCGMTQAIAHVKGKGVKKKKGKKKGKGKKKK